MVEDWTEECQKEEDRQKKECCDIHLYLITSEMQGVFSIVEAVESSMTDGKITILQVMTDGFTEAQIKSLQAVMKMVSSHGGTCFFDNGLHQVSEIINHISKL